jgi:hypothetical protein
VGHLLAQYHKPPSQFPPFKKAWKKKVKPNVVVSEKVMEGNSVEHSPSKSQVTNPSVRPM